VLTQFLFIQEQTISSLILDEQSQIIQPLESQPFDSFHNRLSTGRTIVVLPCEKFSFHEVELPLLHDKKARLAIPYALEENVAQPIDELHFAFDRTYHTDGRYLVAVCQLSYLQGIIASLQEKGILFDAITIDWFALNQNEYCVLSDVVFIRTPMFQGTLDLPIAQAMLESIPEKPTIIGFTNSAKNIVPKKQRLKMPSQSWMAERLLKHPLFNLCQGVFLQRDKTAHLRQWYLLAAGLCGLWIFTVIGLTSYRIYVDNREIKKLDQDIASIYYHFFPKATQIISPQFRINQYLKSNAGSQDTALWILLSKLTRSLQNSTNKVQEIYWQNHQLQVKVAARNFTSLNQLQESLKKTGIHVKQNQAATQDNLVISTLELSL